MATCKLLMFRVGVGVRVSVKVTVWVRLKVLNLTRLTLGV